MTSMFFNLVGSLGLFLLGMWLMTEGLKLAGGRALENLLSQWTSGKFRGLASGILITALVQSSSAVTVATMGFVSAGLLSFQKALWVVFGSNVGTTFTAWIITFFGFSVDIDAFIFPLVGVGAGMRIFFPYERGKALGMALAGFGLLFMGIDALQENFSEYATHINIESVLSTSSYQTLLALGIGVSLTVLTQSSSAAIAIILTAVASGVVGVHVAAAAVIGANVGTTSTAILASIGASTHVKRLAWAHVTFNLLTGVVAYLILPIFWPFVTSIADAMQVGSAVMLLAIFHTCFNILGIILIWPIEPRLTRFLLTLYAEPEIKTHPDSKLDTNVANIPDLAIRVMTIELRDITESISNMVLPESDQDNIDTKNLTAIKERLSNINDFISLALKSGLTEHQGDQLTLGLSVSHHLNYACLTFDEALGIYQSITKKSPIIPKPLHRWFGMVNEFNHVTQHSDTVLQHEQLQDLTHKYQSIKMQLLAAAVNERIKIGTVDNALQAASLSRRFIEQIAQANDAYQTLARPNVEEKPKIEEEPQTKKEQEKEAESTEVVDGGNTDMEPTNTEKANEE